MQALVKARSKLSPCWRSRRIPGRFWRSQFGGKCWIARSWSVRKRMMFIPATSPLLAFRGGQRLLDAGALGEQQRRGGAWRPSRAAACGSARPRRSSDRSFAPLRFAPEDVDGIAGERGRVEIAAVGAERDRADAAQRLGARAARHRFRREAAGAPGQLRDFAGLVAVENRDRAGGEGGDVDVGPVRGDGEPLRGAQRLPEGAADGAQPDQAAGRSRPSGSGRRPGPRG